MNQEQTEQDHPNFTISGIDLTEVECINSDPLVRFYDIDEERMLFGKVRDMEVPKEKQEKSNTEVAGKSVDEAAQTYMRVDVQYQHQIGERNVKSDLFYEGPEMTAQYGLKCRVQGKKVTWSLLTIFDLPDEGHIGYITTMENMHSTTANHLHSIRGKIKMPHFSVDIAEATGFKFPIVYPRDADTCEIIEGASPMQWINLIGSGKFKTKFTFPGAKKDEVIDWDLLVGAKFRFTPCFQYTHVYIGGGKMSMQIKLASAVITDIEPSNAVARNIGTADALARADPEIEKKMRAQLEQMKNIKLANQDPDGGKNEGSENGGTKDPTYGALKNRGANNPESEKSENSSPPPSPPIKTPATSLGKTPSIRGISGSTPKIGNIPHNTRKNTKTPSKHVN
jgi:hypothetical protein